MSVSFSGLRSSLCRLRFKKSFIAYLFVYYIERAYASSGFLSRMKTLAWSIGGSALKYWESTLMNAYGFSSNASCRSLVPSDSVLAKSSLFLLNEPLKVLARGISEIVFVFILSNLGVGKLESSLIGCIVGDCMNILALEGDFFRPWGMIFRLLLSSFEMKAFNLRSMIPIPLTGIIFLISSFSYMCGRLSSLYDSMASISLSLLALPWPRERAWASLSILLSGIVGSLLETPLMLGSFVRPW